MTLGSTARSWSLGEIAELGFRSWVSHHELSDEFPKTRPTILLRRSEKSNALPDGSQRGNPEMRSAPYCLGR